MTVELKRNPKGKYLRFEIIGQPKSKQSVRSKVATDKNGNPVKKLTSKGKSRFVIQQFQDKDTMSNELWVKWNIKGQLPFGHVLYTGPVIVHKLHYIFYPPKKHLKHVQAGEFIRKETKPDLSDNLNKMVFDAMQGIVYLNDSQVAEMHNVKKYYGLQPKILIELEEV